MGQLIETENRDSPRLEVALCELGLLGVRCGGEWTSARGERTSSLLAMLALGRSDGVGTDELLEAIWPSPSQPTSARQSLANIVSRLRSAHGSTFITSTRSGYRLGDHVVSDREQFLNDVEIASGVVANEPRDALDLVDTALGRWRGEPWMGLERPSKVAADRAYLLDSRSSAIKVRTTALLALGRPELALPQLREMVQLNPFDEVVRHQLARALSDTGHRSEALRTIRDARRHLSERGLVIDAELASLENQLVGADYTSGTERAPLPQERTAFIGRGGEADDITGAMGTSRLVTIHGPGGSGKTRLALWCAAMLSEDQACGFVDLATARPGSDVALAIARGLGLPRDRIVMLEPDEQSQALANVASASGGVLVIDNCEHVLDDVRSFLERLLDQPGGLRVLATSRVPLGVAGERRFPIPKFTNGVELFERRVLDQGLAIDLAVDGEIVGTICDLVDDLPLAIEIAAAQAPYRTPYEIADELRLGMVHRDASQDDSRHQTLWSAIQWSRDLLDPVTSDALLKLGVFGTPFQRDDALAVLGASTAHDTLDRLVHASLVERHLDGQRSAYRLLVPVQQYCEAALERDGRSQDAATDLAEWLLQLTERPYGDVWWRLSVADELAPRLPMVWPAIDALQAAGRIDAAAQLASRFARPAHLSGHLDELIDILSEQWPATHSVEARADALLALALCAIAGRKTDIYAQALGSLGALESADHLRNGIYAVYENSMWIMMAELLEGKDFHLANEVLQQARELEAELQSPIDLAAIEMYQSGINLLNGDWTAAAAAARRSLAQSSGTTIDLTSTSCLCHAMLHLGDVDEALALASTHPERERHTYFGDRLGIVAAIGLVQNGDVVAGLTIMSTIQQRSRETSFATNQDDTAIAVCYIAHLLDRDDLATEILDSGVFGQGPWVGHLVPKMCRDLGIALTAQYTSADARGRFDHYGELATRILTELTTQYL